MIDLSIFNGEVRQVDVDFSSDRSVGSPVWRTLVKGEIKERKGNFQSLNYNSADHFTAIFPFTTKHHKGMVNERSDPF